MDRKYPITVMMTPEKGFDTMAEFLTWAKASPGRSHTVRISTRNEDFYLRVTPLGPLVQFHVTDPDKGIL